MAGRAEGKAAFITAGQGMGRAASALATVRAQIWATDLNAKTVSELEGKDGIRTRAYSTSPMKRDSESQQRGGRHRRAVQLRGHRASRLDPRRDAEGLGPGVRGKREIDVPGDARLSRGC